MGYEIDFLHVGDGERSGDAIAVRYGVPGRYAIHVVDGGDLAAGERMVEHIQTHYGSPRRIDAVVCTHGDDDHSSGLRRVIEAFEIGGIWMNRPWLYADELVDFFHDGRMTPRSLHGHLRDRFSILREIEDMAAERGILVHEAFRGTRVGAFTILAPSRERYLALLPQFERTPEPAAQAAEVLGLRARVAQGLRDAVEWIRERWDYETLEEHVETSASNESSVVQMAELDGSRILLTGDAGIGALEEAADYAEWLGHDLPGLSFVQVPHHGSRHNVSPYILDRWIGARLPLGANGNTTAFASVAKESTTHPRRKVVNAFMRRGAKVFSTKGTGKHHSHQIGDRGWRPAVPHDFSDQVEA